MNGSRHLNNYVKQNLKGETFKEIIIIISYLNPKIFFWQNRLYIKFY